MPGFVFFFSLHSSHPIVRHYGANRDALPVNCRLEMDDLNLSLEHYYDSTHLIHIRLLASGIRDYPGFIDQCTGCLKPGGILYFCETDFRPYAAPDPKSIYQTLRSRRSMEGTGGGQAGGGGGQAGDTKKKPKKQYISPLVLMLQAIVSALHQKMAHIDAAANLRGWIRDHKLLDELTYNELYLPLMQLFPSTCFVDRVAGSPPEFLTLLLFVIPFTK